MKSPLFGASWDHFWHHLSRWQLTANPGGTQWEPTGEQFPSRARTGQAPQSHSLWHKGSPEGPQGVPGGAILHPMGPQLGPRWCQSGPKRHRKGMISEPRGPSESIFTRLARKRVIYAKPTFFLGRTTNSAGPGRVRGLSGGAFWINFLVKSPPWKPGSSKSRAKTAKMHQEGSPNAGVHPGGNSGGTQREPSGSIPQPGAHPGSRGGNMAQGPGGVGGVVLNQFKKK